MRIGEIALFIANFTLILGSVLVTRKRGRSFYGYAWATAVTAVLSLVQIIAEGYRWQMLPVYAASLVTGGLALRRRHPSRKAEARTDTLPEKPRAAAKGLRRGIVAFLFLVYAGVSVTLPTLLPVFSFVKPQGPYPVGTTTMMLEDPSREEPATADPADRRKLMIQIWYPAQAGTGTGPAPYIEHLPEILDGLRQAITLPPFLLGQLKYVHTDAMQNAEPSREQERYPVLLFSHGLTGFRNQNTFQVAELASRGYVVVGIDHAYDAAAVVFPDHTAMLKLEHASGFDAYEEKSRLWVQDAKFVLDQLQRLNDPSQKGMFSGRLDLNKVGMFGHSFGGATAAQMLLADGRVKAALNMDGTLYGKPVPEGGFGKPYLQMNAELSISRDVFDKSLDQAIQQSGRSREDYEQFWDESAKRRQRAAASSEAYSVTFAHANHMSFTDFYLFSPLLHQKGAEPRQMQASINALTVAFFDRYVKGNTGPSIEEVAGRLPGVTMP